MRRGVSRHPPRSSFPLRATPRTKRSSVIHPPQSISSIPLVAEGWLCCLARGSLQPAPRLIPSLCRSSQEKGLLIDFYERFEPRHDHKVVQLLLSSLFSTRFSSFLISRGYRCSFARVGSDLNLNTLLRAVNMVFVWCVTGVSRGSS